VADELKGTPLGDAAAASSNCLKLGAVFHDVLFYLRGPGKTAPFLALADELHGTRGEDTYEIVRKLIDVVITSKQSGQLVAFLVGVISHIHTDLLFHPMVFYMTGNYFDSNPKKKTKAIQGHRRIEAMMDLYFCGGPSELKRYSLKGVIKKAEVTPADLFADALADMAREKGLTGLRQALDRALKTFAFMQRICRNQILSYILYSIERILPNGLKEFSALFYARQLRAELSKISGVISYRNTVTGLASEHRLKTIFDMAVEKSAAFCRKIEPSIVDKRPVKLNNRGPSLGVGLESVSVNEASYFAATPLI